MKPWQRLDATEVEQVGFRTIVQKQFLMNDGRVKRADIDGSEGMQAVCVIALTDDRQVVIARQFRCGPEKVLDDLPGGIVDPGESLEAAGKRELLEEVGYTVGELEYIGWVYIDPWHNGIHHYYIAHNCQPAPSNNPEEDEEIETVLMSIAQLLDNAKTGKMTDAAGVLLAYDRLRELEEINP